MVFMSLPSWLHMIVDAAIVVAISLLLLLIHMRLIGILMELSLLRPSRRPLGAGLNQTPPLPCRAHHCLALLLRRHKLKRTKSEGCEAEMWLCNKHVIISKGLLVRVFVEA